MSGPIIVAGTTDSGTRYVQFWTTDRVRNTAGLTGPIRWAAMNSRIDLLQISQDCPWIDLVLATFDKWRRGEPITTTHRLTWEFGKPIFTPNAPAEPDQVPVPMFDIEGTS